MSHSESSMSFESSYQCIREIRQTHPVSAIAFNSALTCLAASLPGTFKIWDITDGHELYHELHPHANKVGALFWITFRNRTELLLTASDVILAWKYSVQQKRYLLVPSALDKSHDEICSMDVKLVDNVYLICTCSPDGCIATWEVNHIGTIRNLWSVKMDNRPVKVAFMDKNKILVFTRAHQVIFEINVDDVNEKVIQHVLPYRCLTSVAFHPRSRTIAVVNSGGVDMTSLRRLERYTRLHTAFLQQRGSENSMAFFEDGKKVVVGTVAGKAQIFDVKSGACLQELRFDGHRQARTVAIGGNEESTCIAVATSDPSALNVLRIYRTSPSPTYHRWPIVVLTAAVIIMTQLCRSGPLHLSPLTQRLPIPRVEASSTSPDLTSSQSVPLFIPSVAVIGQAHLEVTYDNGEERDNPIDESSTFFDLNPTQSDLFAIHNSALGQSDSAGITIGTSGVTTPRQRT